MSSTTAFDDDASQVAASGGPLRTPRIPLIDTLRGVALIAMASYHFTWDLEFFGYLEVGTSTQGAWKIYARLIATSFLMLVGLSLLLAHGQGIRWPSFRKRLLLVAGAAAVISIATRIAMPQEWIFFGILHHIALASLLALAFLRVPPLLTGLLAVALFIAMVLDTWIMPGLLSFPLFDTRLLAWTGFAETIPRSNDFVPVFPWFAAVLAGVAIGGLLRDHGGFARLAAWQQRDNLLTKAGRHSLAFYLIHQPVLIGLVYLASLIHPAPAVDPIVGYTQSCARSCVAEGNDAGLCDRFCDCTANKLVEQSLFMPMQRGDINPATDPGVQSIAQECTIISR
ncbi:putative membrane protein [Neorhizobium galegae]|nr:putative membrane protein [Neorhizobium galegae]